MDLLHVLHMFQKSVKIF